MENESNKQTAIQWFIEQLEQKGDASENLFVRRVQISIHTSDYLELKRQAKEMEKKQIIDAWIATDNELQRISAEQYYEQTYGGNK